MTPRQCVNATDARPVTCMLRVVKVWTGPCDRSPLISLLCFFVWRVSFVQIIIIVTLESKLELHFRLIFFVSGDISCDPE